MILCGPRKPIVRNRGRLHKDASEPQNKKAHPKKIGGHFHDASPSLRAYRAVGLRSYVSPVLWTAGYLPMLHHVGYCQSCSGSQKAGVKRISSLTVWMQTRCDRRKSTQIKTPTSRSHWASFNNTALRSTTPYHYVTTSLTQTASVTKQGDSPMVLAQVLGLDVNVFHRHLNRRMPEHPLEHGDGAAPPDVVRCHSMSETMEQPLRCMNPEPDAKLTNIPMTVPVRPLAAVPCREDKRVPVLVLPLPKMPSQFKAEGNLALTTSLPVECEQEIVEVHVAPSEGQRFVNSGSRGRCPSR